MAYNQEVFAAAQQTLEERRAAAEGRANALRSRMIARYPRVAQLEAEMAASTREITKAVLAGGDIDAVIADVRARNEEAQAELARLLHEAGEAADNFAPQYTCSVCGDTGYTDHGVCDCLHRLLADNAAKRLGQSSGMKLTSLDEMDLSFYKEQLPMKRLLDFCRDYGEHFAADSDSLLLFGPTGVGKTHVSLALAKIAAEKGFTVVYGPAQQLLSRLEREHFGKAEGDTASLLTEAELLVLDDLGTELNTPFYQTALYDIINARLLTERPTIISTNLSPAELQGRYGVQIASRILGTYLPLPFKGDDIRQQKLERRLRGL